MTVTEPLTVRVAAGVAVVTLDRPEARNALNAELRSALYHTMSRLDADPEVSVVVLTGADPAFCAGLDLKELAGDDHVARSAASAAIRSLRSPIPTMSKPVIGAINGVAITGGFELALACDFLVASENARFADTHTRVGILPGWGLTVLLPQAIGLRRAKELSCTGNFLDAQTALDWGLVNHVVAHDELMPTALALAADVVGNDPDAVRQIFATYDAGSMTTGAEALEIEQRDSRAAGLTRGTDLEARRRAVTERGRSQI